MSQRTRAGARKKEPAHEPEAGGPGGQPSGSRPAVEPNISRPATEPNRARGPRPALVDYVSDVDTDGDDIVWEYESEELHTPVSSDDEGNKHHWPEFNDQYSFGEGRFELGTRFATIERFKEVVNDTFIAEGRELV